MMISQSLAQAPAGRQSAVFDVLGVAGFVALGALVRIPLPFSPVPVTLQTFSVLVAAFAVGRSRATLGIALYVGLGLAGAPLLAAASWATLGYLMAFVATPYAVARFRNPLFGMCAASLLIYGMGAAWLCVWLGLPVWQALLLGVFPFIPGDLLKLLAAYKVVGWIRP